MSVCVCLCMHAEKSSQVHICVSVCVYDYDERFSQIHVCEYVRKCVYVCMLRNLLMIHDIFVCASVYMQTA